MLVILGLLFKAETMPITLVIDRESIRAGNLIWNTYYNRAEYLSVEGYNNIYNNVPISHQLKGIQLTPGWCENLGGEMVIKTEGDPGYIFRNPNVGSFTVFFAGHIAYMKFDSLKREIRTVHQLQNIVFYLLGIDLRYNPPKHKHDG